jgi:hypothetical protein
MSICVIECIFGGNFKTVYPAVKNYDSYFFTNNREIKQMVETAGWTFVFVDFPLSNDSAVSSFQSKYIKFLQFLKNENYSYFNRYDTIIYSDHKLKLKYNHVKYLLKELNGYEILVRDHPSNRKNIWEEVGAAMFQERYLRFMPQTIDWIREKINDGYSEIPTVVWTSLIIYKHLNKKTIDFVDNVYGDLQKTGTSECQIIWSMLGQKHKDIIKIIRWNELNIKWEVPNKIGFAKMILKLFIPYGVIKLWQTVKDRPRPCGRLT